MDKLFIAIIIFFMIFVTLIFLLIKSLGKIRNQKNARKAKYSAHISATFKHIRGLPLANGVFLTLYYGKDKITFVNDSQEIVLDFNKIINIEISLGRNMRIQTVSGSSSIPRTKLVITYNKEDKKTQFIILDAEYSGAGAMKIVNDFKKNHSVKTQKVEL